MSSNRQVSILSVGLIALITATVVYAATTSYVGFRYGGTIRTVGVGIYCNASCNQSLSWIDVGLVDPGAIRNSSVFVRNEGNVPVVLSLQTLNWDPPNASDFVSLGWNYDGHSMSPSEVAEISMSLSISSGIHDIAVFGFDVIISGVGTANVSSNKSS
jgi:hypothetical protein